MGREEKNPNFFSRMRANGGLGALPLDLPLNDQSFPFEPAALRKVSQTHPLPSPLWIDIVWEVLVR